MTLDEIEKLAREWLKMAKAHGQDNQLARAVLLMLPVVRAAEQWRDAPENRHGNGKLAHAIDHLRASLKEQV